MKTKLFAILFSVALYQQAFCQADTLFVGDREPTYYYWDTNWWDHGFLHFKDIVGDVPDDYHVRYYAYGLGGKQCKVEYARPCIADSTIRIIGIAACTEIVHPESPDRLPEYLRLYQRKENATDNGDLVLLAEGRWDTVTPRRYMAIDSSDWTGSWTATYVPVREVYFSNPIDLSGEFFVGITGNNNFRFGVPDTDYYDGQPIFGTHPVNHVCRTAGFYTVPGSRRDDRRLWPVPGYFMRKAHLVDEFNFSTTRFTDTNWHEEGGAAFIHVFAIIDTSKHTQPPSSCDKPEELRVLGTWSDHSVIAWSDNQSGPWEVAYGANSLTDTNVETKTVNTRYASINDLKPNTQYCVCARTLCDSSLTSEWSDTLCFYTESVGIEGATTEQEIRLSPNPASDRVTVTAPILIEDVELYSTQGVCLQKTPVNNTAAGIDISGLPKGMYLVYVKTAQGTARKKLVIN